MTDAVIYLRISRDDEATGLALDRQREDCQRIASERGWTVVNTYSETVSASDRRKKRPQYEAMREAYQRGEFEAVIAWDLDRLTRQPRELEDWIDDAESRGLALVTANGEADLTTDAGRLFARLKAAVARSEIERKSARQNRRNDQDAAAGIPFRTKRPFGWERDAITLHPEESKELAWMHDQILKGASIRSIARDLNERGVKTPKGGEWEHANVRSVLKRARNAGLLIRKGVIQEKSQIQPAVTRETWEAVQAILDDPTRHTSKGRHSDRWWMSGVATCPCGSALGSKIQHQKSAADGTRGKVPMYICRATLENHQSGHVAIKASILEETALTSIFFALQKRRTAAIEAPEVVRLTKELEAAQQARVSAQELFMVPGVDKADAMRRIAEAAEKVDALTAQRNRAMADRAGEALIASVQTALAAFDAWSGDQSDENRDAAEEADERFIATFNDLPTETKRALAKSLLKVEVKKGGKGRKRVLIEHR